MSNSYLYLLMALLAGAMMPIQAAVNNRMVAYVESPIIAAFMSFLIGTVALMVYGIVSGVPVSGIAGARNAPLIAWTGGLLGAFFVTSTVVLLPRLGVAMTFSLVIAGQMIVTLIVDHFGLLGVDVRPIGWQRVAGILLITGGVILIRRF